LAKEKGVMLEKNATVMNPEDAECSGERDKSDASPETQPPPPPHEVEAKAEEMESKALAVAFLLSPVDRYGFLVTDKCVQRARRYNGGHATSNTYKHAVWLENRRTQKWVKMIGKQLEDWEHSLFRDRSSLGQCALMNVLKAYSLHDPEVGYCQGMGFLSAMFLCYMPEQQAFWLLVACLNHKRYGLADLYRPRMPKVPEVTFVFEGLFKQLMPQLSAHLENEGLHPTMYLTQWFLTLFTYNFPFEFVTRVWDTFLHEGWKVIYRVALALMKISQKTLLSSKFEIIMEYFRDLPNKVDTDEVLTVAFRMPIKRAQIAHLLEEYHSSSAAS
ncbi:hypothetical protein JG688_00018153, partial [Phytophthora aleatoria]